MSDSTEDLLRATSDVSSNIGTYLARRMIELGIRDYFVVPGDFNLVLLDQILQFPQLRLISCCNELNAAYAADGYARAKVASTSIDGYNIMSFGAMLSLSCRIGSLNFWAS